MTATSNLQALLIGTDFYLPGTLADGRTYYPSLNGSVRDIEHVESLLVQVAGLAPERISKLTATNVQTRDQQQPIEPPELWPTYDNMVAAFERIMQTTDSGDAVYIHYSGHGGRAPTLVPEHKGTDGLDEALVPLDIHRQTGRYLRDIELAFIFQRMVHKGLHLTVVLDSCHSGGAVRGQSKLIARGLGIIDTTPRPTDSRFASLSELGETWRRLTPTTTRAFSYSSGWLPEPRGYALLAACTAAQFAYEYPFDGRETNGVLTYCLLDTLRTFGVELSCQHIYDRILARVHSQFHEQTPQLQGDAQQRLFGSFSGASATPANAIVLEVDASDQRVRISTGLALGVRDGAQFAVYPLGTSTFDEAGRQALATVVEVGPTSSWAEIGARFSSDAIVQGAPAPMLDSSGATVRRTVQLVQSPEFASSADHSAALDAVRAAMADNAFLLEATSDLPVDYQVAVNEGGEYEFRDPAGDPISNIRPPLRISDATSAARIVQRLVHLAKYQNVQQISNTSTSSTLGGKIVVELLGLQRDYLEGEPHPGPFTEPGHMPIVPVDWWTFLRIRNESAERLHVAVLDLQHDWGITQAWPRAMNDVEFEPVHEETIPLHAELPPGYIEGRDQLKVFATREPINLRVMQLPALDQPVGGSAVRGGGITRGPTNALEGLLSALVSDPPPGSTALRTFAAPATSTEDWTTVAVELIVQRTPPPEDAETIGAGVTTRP